MKRIIKLLFALIVILLPLFTNAENKKATLYFFHGKGCSHCAEEKKFLKTIEEKYPELEIVQYEVWYNEENAELLHKVEEVYPIESSGVPTNIIGNTVISGYNEALGGKLERAIKYYLKHDCPDNIKRIQAGDGKDEIKIVDEFQIEEEKSDSELSIKLPLIGKVNLKNISIMSAAAVIGLIDGFNPCAMWILLFLISVLIGMKDRKRMWILGLAFLLTSALVYMLIMLSWIQIAVEITTIVWVRRGIAIISLLGAVFNIRSYLKSKDSGCEVVDEKKRKRIFQKIRKFTSEKSFLFALLGVIGLAISVNLVELACSAGLPLVFTELLALNNISNEMRFIYTLVYIFFFLIDDLVIFFIAMLTMRVTGISTKYNKYSHLIGGILMLLIGILLLVKPEWLMFQF